MTAPMRYIVERQSALGGNAAYTGPMATLDHAERERDAWIGCGYAARVIDYDDATRARVRQWTRGDRWPYPTEVSA